MHQGELQHKNIKQQYNRTNKNDFVTQLATQEARERLLMNISARMQGDLLPKDSKSQREEKKASLPYVNPEDHYHISSST